MSVRCLGIIPARGGSKGLPRKNLLPLAGLPLIAHSILCARSAKALSRTIVSTDDAEIAAVAKLHGAEVPGLRPAELAGDDVPTLPVLAHALTQAEKDGDKFDLVALLEPTSPIRFPEDVDRAVQALADDVDALSVKSVSEPSFNPFWVGVTVKDGYLAPAFPNAGAFTKRQDVPRFLRINGVIYAWRREFILNPPKRWSDGKHLPFEIKDELAISIDTRADLDHAAALLDSGTVNLPWLRN